MQKTFWRYWARCSRPVHVAWCVAWLCMGIVVGIGLAAWVPVHASLPLGLVAASVLVIALINRSAWAMVLVVCAGIGFGLVRGGAMQHALGAYEPYYGKLATVQGVVSEDTTLGTRGEQRAYLGDVHIDGVALAGRIWASTTANQPLKRSDHVTVHGVVGKGFGTTPATMYDVVLVSVERSPYGDVALTVRDWFAAAVRRAIPEPQASLGVGFLLGQRSTLPVGLDNQLRILGLTHIVVASGYNLTLLVRFARRGFAKYSKYLAMLGSFGCIFGFIAMTGASPSMSRAGLVAGLSLLAWYVGRTIQPVIILAVSAAVTALIHPSYVWGDLGWYLSFLSFAGIMLLAPLIQHYFWGKDAQLDVVRRIIIETLSAQLATLPLLAWVFGQYAVLSLPANVLVLPLIPLAMAFTFAAGIGALLVPKLAYIVGLPATFVLSYMTMITGWLASISWATFEIRVGVWHMILGYVLLIAAGFYMWRVTKHRFSTDNIVV